MAIIPVPSSAAPTQPLCWQTPPLDGSQGHPMRHCDRAAGHGGKHSWEYVDAIQKALDVLRVEMPTAYMINVSTWLRRRDAVARLLSDALAGKE